MVLIKPPRILAALGMSEGDVCTAGELCRRKMELPELVKLVWKEEDGEGRKRREELFWAGVGKYM